MPKGNPGGNPEVLMAAAEAKKQEALEKTERAIAQLVKSEEKITFKSVAALAGVSVPYLYKWDEIKERIQYLREQQKQKPTKRKRRPQSFQPASDRSKQVIIHNLKEDNKRLRQEIAKQKKHIEVVQGRLYELSMVGEENKKLRQQLDKVNLELKKTKAELDYYLLSNPTAHPKVTPLYSNKNKKPITELDISLDNPTQKHDMGTTLVDKLSNMGIRLNSTLYKLIESKSTLQVENAIDAVEEYISTGKQVKSLAGLFRKAVEEEWKPNLTAGERKIAAVKDEFSEWFKLAALQGIVTASQGTKEGIIVKDSGGEWILFTKMIEKGWTLEYLKSRM